MKFKILQNGLVRGGSASYEVDPSGLIKYRGSIKVGKWLISKTYNFEGKHQIDPTLLAPGSLAPGNTIVVGYLVMKVMSLGQGSALVSLAVTGEQATGTAILNTSKKVIELQTLDATVTVMGMQLAIGLRQA